jgi:hypothetical protein
MGLLGRLLGTESVVNGVTSIAKEYIIDKDKWAEFETRIQEAALAHKSVFVTILVAGPKPFLLWVCGVGFAIHYVLNPIMSWVAFFFNYPTLPIIQIDAADLYALAAMGGFSVGARSYEKKHNAQGNH